MVNYIGILSGVSWLIISVLCQTSHDKLYEDFVRRLVVNYLGILSGVSW
jgi:hypothetical protein